MNAVGPGDLVKCIWPGPLLGKVFTIREVVVPALGQLPCAACGEPACCGLLFCDTPDPHPSEALAWSGCAFVPIDDGEKLARWLEQPTDEPDLPAPVRDKPLVDA